MTKDRDETYRYQSILKTTPIKKEKLKLGKEGKKIKINTSQPGTFEVNVKNKEGSVLMTYEYEVAGDANLAAKIEKNAELKVSLNKSDYKAGEEIELSMVAPYQGAGLITIERDQVYSWKWFKTENNSTVERIQVPEGIDGGAYVNVMFVRSMQSSEIFMSPLSYAVKPFSISLDSHLTTIKLQAPPRVYPGEKFRIKYSSSKPTQILLYGVDEGILSLADYHMPDPLRYFFRKRALQVTTTQMMDLLLPEFSRLMAMAAPGGDEGRESALGSNLNPFKAKRQPSVVFWSGVLASDESERSYTYQVPDYFNGNLKIMAVASRGDGLGKSEIQTTVRGDYIITPNVPVFVTPSDDFTVGVSVSNQKSGSGAQAKVQLAVAASKHLKLEGPTHQELNIPEGREVSTALRFKATDVLGEGALTFWAGTGPTAARFTTTMSVRPASAFVNWIEIGLATQWPMMRESKIDFYPEYHKSKLKFGLTPMGLASALALYLDNYPYGCTEQVISKAFPSILLRSSEQYAPDLEKARDLFAATIGILRSRQSSDGEFALYNPANEPSHPMASLYAIHFLLEAREHGLTVPPEMVQLAKEYLGRDSATSSELIFGESQFNRAAYKLYLLARFEIVDGSQATQLMQAFQRRTAESATRTDIGGLYLAGALQLYKKQAEAQALMKNFKLFDTKKKSETNRFYDYENYINPWVRDSIFIYISSKHFPEMSMDLEDNDKLVRYLEPLVQGQLDSHSVSWSLLAIEAFTQTGTPKTHNLDIKVSVKTPTTKDSWQRINETPKKEFELPSSFQSIKAESLNGGLAYFSYSRSGFPRSLSATETKKGLEIQKVFTDDSGKELTSVALGTEVTVHLRVRAMDHLVHQHVAMVDLLPAGFEMIIPQLTAESSYSEASESSEDAVRPGSEEPVDYDAGESTEGQEGVYHGPEPMIRDLWLLPFFIPRATAQERIPASVINSLSPDFVDRREDRMVIYTSVTGELLEFQYKMKAVNEGDFVVPPAFGEGMYDKSLYYLGKPTRIKISKP